MSTDHIDESGNHIIVCDTCIVLHGLPVLLALLRDDPYRGYLALAEKDWDFGDESCPSSYVRPCIGWFGEGEREPDAETALNAVSALASECDCEDCVAYRNR